MPEVARYSDVDTRRFGKRIYRAEVAAVVDVEALDAFAEVERVDMVIVRCPVARSAAVHALESSAYRLMDTLVYYAGPANGFERATWSHSIRAATGADREALTKVAQDAFANYDGHYHADPRLDPRLATEGYVDWCLNCLAGPGHEVLVAVQGDALMGFIASRRDEEKGIIELNGVASVYQRRGVYDSLVKAAGRALFAGGATEIRSSTHLGNLAPQRAWIRNGMSIDSAVHTFHKWFEV